MALQSPMKNKKQSISKTVKRRKGKQTNLEEETFAQNDDEITTDMIDDTTKDMINDTKDCMTDDTTKDMTDDTKDCMTDDTTKDMTDDTKDCMTDDTTKDMTDDTKDDLTDDTKDDMTDDYTKDMVIDIKEEMTGDTTDAISTLLDEKAEEEDLEVGDVKEESVNAVSNKETNIPHFLRPYLMSLNSYRETDPNCDRTVLEYPCRDCSKSFLLRKDRSRHIRECHKVFKCPVDDCNRVFQCSSNRTKHLETVHLRSTTQQCHMCAKFFKGSASLQNHIEKVHTEKELREQFVCDICDKVFYSKAGLGYHRSIHTGEKAFVCPVEKCGKAFRLKDTLQKHQRSVHEKKQPYECSVCDQKFSRKAYYEHHLYKHTGVKPFVCEICQKSFSQNGNLKVHMQTHSEDRPVWQCTVCDKTFHIKSNYTKHKETVHSKATKKAARKVTESDKRELSVNVNNGATSRGPVDYT